MAKVRKVDYFVMQARNRAGEGARLLKGLKQQGIALMAFTAFPDGGGAQVDFVADDSRAFVAAAKALKWKIHSRKAAFLVTGKDRTGALSGLLGKLGKAGINVTAMNAVAAGKRRFGAIFWVSPPDVGKTAKLLGA
jgi:hypothetical protein